MSAYMDTSGCYTNICYTFDSRLITLFLYLLVIQFFSFDILQLHLVTCICLLKIDGGRMSVELVDFFFL